LSSFYEWGSSPNDIKRLIEENVSYSDLKEIKYLLQCACALGAPETCVLDEKLTSMEAKRNALSEYITIFNRTTLKGNEDFTELINKCMVYKMQPEQLACIEESEYFLTDDILKEIAIRFFNGLTLQEYKKTLSECRSGFGCDIETLLKNTDKIIHDKISDKFNNDERINFDSEFIDAFERVD
jgi:hypothetical protein